MLVRNNVRYFLRIDVNVLRILLICITCTIVLIIIVLLFFSFYFLPCIRRKATNAFITGVVVYAWSFINTHSYYRVVRVAFLSCKRLKQIFSGINYVLLLFSAKLCENYFFFCRFS